VTFNPSDISDHYAREEAYKYLNLLYQCGVFVSRSTASFLKANLFTLWTMPVLQLAFLIFFIINADGTELLKGWILLLPAFFVGLVAGALYFSYFVILTRKLPKKLHELALSSACQATNIGMLFANVCSLYIQWCLFKSNSIEDQAGGKCPAWIVL